MFLERDYYNRIGVVWRVNSGRRGVVIAYRHCVCAGHAASDNYTIQIGVGNFNQNRVAHGSASHSHSGCVVARSRDAWRIISASGTVKPIDQCASSVDAKVGRLNWQRRSQKRCNRNASITRGFARID